MPGLEPIRLSRGLSKSEVGRRIGVTRSMVGRYEKGKSSIGADRLKALAAALDCTVDDLLREPSPTEVPTDG